MKKNDHRIDESKYFGRTESLSSEVNISFESSTGGSIVVLTPYGATVLTRILSFAHSQAKFLVSWLIAAAEVASHTNKALPCDISKTFSSGITV